MKTIRQLRSSMVQFSVENASNKFAQNHCQTQAIVDGDWTESMEEQGVVSGKRFH